jgi:hypothetical protein
MGSLYQVDSTGLVQFKQKGTEQLVLEQGTSFPATPVSGQVFYRTDLVQLYIYNGTTWNTQAGGSLRIYNETPSGTVGSGNTLFTAAAAYVAGSTVLTRDGLVMKPGGVDYTETSPSAGTVTFVTAPVAGSTILISYSKTIGQDVPKLLKQSYVTGTVSAPYTGSTTVFDLPFTYTPGSGSVLVFSGGVLMIVTSDYTETDTDTITFVSARTTGEIITFIKLGIAGGESGQTGGWNDQGTYVTLDTSTDQVRIGDGAVGTPALSFASDVNTGLYHVGADDIALATNGIKQLEVNTTAVTTFLPTAIKGTTTNDSAAAGNVGELIEATGNATTQGPTSITSISLTAGDWQIWGGISYNGATGGTNILVGISENNNSFTGCIDGYSRNWGACSSADGVGGASCTRAVSLSSTTTFYMVGQLNVSRAQYAGISARRMR